jgi:serine/threonine-protein kinase
MAEEVPRTIGGRWNVVRELGRGGMGVVYEVARAGDGERFAVKAMLWGQDRPDLLERFRREAHAAAVIASEHVVRVVDSGTAPELGGQPFLAMELLHGQTAAGRIAEHGPFSADRVVGILSQAGHALDRAHAAGIVHRDLKPDNLFLHRPAGDRGPTVVKVLDFGVARLLDDDATAITATGAMVGSLHYMAPEQSRSEKGATGPRADVWAIGMSAIDLLTGERYWQADKPSQLVPMLMAGPRARPSERWPSLPPAFDAWFFRACAPDPAARFPTVGEQVGALSAALHTGAR